jgi:hypothetical protein
MVILILEMRLPNAFRLQCWTAGPGSLFSFHLTATINERIPLLHYTGPLRTKGAPRVGFTRESLYLTVTIDLVCG